MNHKRIAGVQLYTRKFRVAHRTPLMAASQEEFFQREEFKSL